MSKHTNDGSRRFGQSIDAYGYDQALNLFNLHYDKADYILYAWWCGNTLKFTNEDEEGKEQGRELFIQNLKVVCDNMNNGTHTICYYKSIDPDKSIDSNSLYSASFNFRPASRENYSPGQQVSGTIIQQAAIPSELAVLMGKIAENMAAIDGRLKALEEEEEEEEEEEPHPDEIIIDRIERIIDKIDHPESKVGGVVDDFRHVFRTQMKKWGMWGNDDSRHNNQISNTNNNNMDLSNPADLAKLNKAIGEINANWPLFAQQMLKLARILHKDKVDFDYYVRKIDQEFAKIDA